MTYIPKPSILLADSSALDGAHRLRTSSPRVEFSCHFYYDDDTQLMDKAVTGSATITHSVNDGAAVLTSTSADNDDAIYQSLGFFPYQIGTALRCSFSFLLDPTPETNHYQRVGYFSSSNGYFLSLNGTAPSFIRRTGTSGSTVDNAVAQASWNLDTMDGNGSSGVTLDFTKLQILIIDTQWPGRCRLGFHINGEIIYAHEFLSTNVLAVSPNQTATLPVRFEVENDGGTSGSCVIKVFNVAVVDEGQSHTHIGIPFAISNRGTAVTAANGTLTPIISIRPAATFNSIHTEHMQFKVQNFGLYNSDNRATHLQLIWNTTLTDDSWVAVDAGDSAMEYDVSATAISGGLVIREAHLSAKSAESGEIGPLDWLPLIKNLAGTQIPLTIAAQGIGNTCACYGHFNWTEIR